MDMDKGLPGLLHRVMLGTVMMMAEEGEIDESRALLWLESHAVKLVGEDGKYRIEIVKVEEGEDADRT